MSDLVLNALSEALRGHGLTAHRIGAAIHAPDDLVIRPAVTLHSAASDSVTVQLDITTNSPLLGPRTLADSFAGIGLTRDAAEMNAFAKFLLGSFHALIEALTRYQCASKQVEWAIWQRPDYEWRVCAGPLLTHSQAEDAASGLYPGFFEKLRDLFLASAPLGAHWVSVFFASSQGRVLACEVSVNNNPWPHARELLGSMPWSLPETYESLRQFILCLPGRRDQGE